MSANVETMFSVRETPWHGLGRIVIDAPASREALELAGLDWQVESRNIYSGTGAMIPGYRANVRSTDEAVRFHERPAHGAEHFQCGEQSRCALQSPEPNSRCSGRPHEPGS